MDSLSQALSQRRGKSLDGKLYAQEHELAADTNASPQPQNLPQPGIQHTEVKGENQAAPLPLSQSDTGPKDQATLAGSPEEHAQIQAAILGHQSPGDQERLEAAGPRTLGERVRLMAMKEKNGK